MAHRLHKNDVLPNLKNDEFPSWFRMAHRLYKNDDLPDLKTVNVHRYVKYKSWIRGFFFFKKAKLRWFAPLQQTRHRCLGLREPGIGFFFAGKKQMKYTSSMNDYIYIYDVILYIYIS